MAKTCIIILSLIISIANLAHAETGPVTKGEIVLESYEAPSETAVEKRKKTTDFISELAKSFDSIAKGNPVILPTMSQDLENAGLNFTKDALVNMTIAHLRCSIAEGVCLPVLDTVFELDLMNSAKSGTASCKNMQLFWKLWLENDMEKRHQHQVQIGFLKDTEVFNRDVRPQYIKCKETISKLLEESTQIGAQAFLKERYAQHPEKIKSPELTLKIFEALEKSNQAAFDLNQ